MWVYEKKLEYPVRISKSDPKLAKIIIAQYGGPDGVSYGLFLQSCVIQWLYKGVKACQIY